MPPDAAAGTQGALGLAPRGSTDQNRQGEALIAPVRGQYIAGGR
jgi:hypothetical protein